MAYGYNDQTARVMQSSPYIMPSCQLLSNGSEWYQLAYEIPM